ncbi:nucleic-acid-binding protein from transposon X-element [Trichonephila clavata]|uniref:Nucleic-acid-binding protein from transposon X-element n=1 Tax=Trichonephila clavata TaxID=2740835 RepID=A0A8X6LIM9_TRICU|nr:nucleic-acid-binding protein from transposon X-element [Trichonephila clavata]
MEQTDDPPPRASTPKQYIRPPPPITIDNVDQSGQFLKKLQELSNSKLSGRMVGKSLRVYPETPAAYKKIRNYLDDNKMQAFTYQLKEDKEFKVVLRGMPADMSPQEIMDDLLVLGISPSYCHVMTNRKTHLPMPLFLVSLPSNEDNRNIYNISEVCSVKVTVEVLNKKPGPAQCYRCQGFFHNSRYCSRCLKCGKPHLTRDCKKTLSEDPTCCNCQETFLKRSHTFNRANFSTYRNDRTSCRGGGTAIIIKNSIRHHTIDIVTHGSEQTAITKEGSPHNLTICSFYKPPSASTPGLINDLLKIFRNRPRCFILGDFNLKHKSWNPTGNGPGGTQLFNFARKCGFCISAPAEPTRIAHHHNARSSVIDFAMSSGLSNITAETMFDLSSDHNPVLYTFTP